ncbi:hypothetical protein GF323_02580 [Candidatus Woesearchaeota archaeon]|nr:hypothetical protein [Candidatus Woesearchaeota archaeon]
MEQEELAIRPHYFTALAIYFLKSLIFVLIIVFTFQIMRIILGIDIIGIIIESIQISIENIFDIDSPLLEAIGLEFLEDRVINIFIATLLLTFAQQSNVINKMWTVTNNEIRYNEGFFSLKNTTAELDKVMRVYGIPRADFKNMGDIYIELSTREKKLKLPCVYHVDALVREISARAEKYKEMIIEKDIERDIGKGIKIPNKI